MTHRLHRLLPLVALLGALVVGCGRDDSAEAARTPPKFFGVVPQGAPPSPQDYRKMGKGDVGTMRFLVPWGNVQPRASSCCNWSVIDGKVGGIAVNIGARVGSIARPSEVLVSRTVKDLVAGSGLSFEDAGEHVLKGVPDRWHLYRVLE